MDTITFNVGVYGLGIIGSRAAGNLWKRGHTVAVWNRTPKPEMPGFEPEVVSVARSSRVHQLFLRDEEAVNGVMERMLPELGPGHTVLVHATVSPQAMKRWGGMVEATGAGFLDTPFTGSRNAAEQGRLVYYVGGEFAVLERVRPILEATSRAIHHFGPVGHATVLKIATNMVTAATVQALAEAMVVTRAGGVDVKLLADAVVDNACRSGTSDLKLASMLAGDFLPHFSLKNMLKDARLAAELAAGTGVELPAHAATTARMEEMVARGQATAESDFSILARQWDHD